MICFRCSRVKENLRMFECGHSLCCLCVIENKLCSLCNSNTEEKVKHYLNNIRKHDPIFHKKIIIDNSLSKKDVSNESVENIKESKNEEICSKCAAVKTKPLNETSNKDNLHKCYMIECPYSSMDYGCSKKYLSNEDFDTHLVKDSNFHIVSFTNTCKKNPKFCALDHELIEKNNNLAKEIHKEQIVLFNKMKSYYEYRKDIQGSYPNIEVKDIQTYTKGGHTLCENLTDSKFYNVEVKALSDFINIGFAKKGDSNNNYLLGICKYSDQEDDQIFVFDGVLMNIKFKINLAEKKIVFLAESAEKNNSTEMILRPGFKIDDFEIILEAEDSYEISFF